MSFFAELKRRNVFRAATFYAASAWLLVQIATQVFPFFHFAEWVVRWIVVAAIIGFPFAMLFSWFYEWTPQGIQRESEVDPSESIMRATGKTSIAGSSRCWALRWCCCLPTSSCCTRTPAR